MIDGRAVQLAVDPDRGRRAVDGGGQFEPGRQAMTAGTRPILSDPFLARGWVADGALVDALAAASDTMSQAWGPRVMSHRATHVTRRRDTSLV
jgi:hypothetical protein